MLTTTWFAQAFTALRPLTNSALHHVVARRLCTVQPLEDTRLRGLDAVEALAQEAAATVGVPNPSKCSAILAADDHHKNYKFKVAIFTNDGKVNVAEKAGSELNIAVRDMPMFNSGQRAGHHATIGVRDGKVLVRTEVVRAVLQRDSLVLFECTRASVSERVGVAVLNAVQSTKSHPTSIPFELQMLEVLLDQTVSYLENKSQQIWMLSKAVQEDINKRVNRADIRRMLPLQKAVTALEYDIQETKHAIREVADNEKLLALLCLTEDQNLTAPRARWSPHMQLAHRLLMSYDSRIRSVDSQLRELTEHLDSTREIWHMQLDAMRNRIIRLNLHLEFAGIATMMSAVPAAMFGMNLVSGLEEAPGLFWYVTAGSVGWGLLAYTGLYMYNTLWPMGMAKRRLADMTALQDLLMYNVDEIGDVVDSLRSAHRRSGAISKERFTEIVNSVIGASSKGGHSINSEKIDLLYRVLDTNHDGELDVRELARAHDGAVAASQDSEGIMEMPIVHSNGDRRLSSV